MNTPWSPIATAPLNDICVDLWVEDIGRVADAYFRKGKWHTYSLAAYDHSMDLNPIPDHWKPTHWMALPPPPQ